MDQFSILTNSKRAVIALIHSLFFLLIATLQMLMAAAAPGIWSPAAVATGTWVLCGIYVVVTSILLWLFVVSRGWIEKAYFALCTVSVASGLLRTILGDHGFPSGRYLRVIMLSFAAVLGVVITRMHSLVMENSSEVES